MHAHKDTRKDTESHRARHDNNKKKKVHTQAARQTQTLRKHTITQPPSLFPHSLTEPGSAEALTNIFTVEGQCLVQTVRQHILLRIESPLLSLPNKYVGGGVGRGGGGVWEEME